jgi:hypothetical protein
MDPNQVERDPRGVMRCRQCGFAYNLQPGEVAAETESGLLAVEAAVAGTPPHTWSSRPEPTVWSVNAYAAHLDQAATVITSRVVAIASQDHPFLPYWEQDEAIESIDGDAISAEQSIARLRPTVERFVSAIRQLPAEAWDRVGRHERAGDVRLTEIAHDMPHELHHHAQDIRTVGQAVAP